MSSLIFCKMLASLLVVLLCLAAGASSASPVGKASDLTQAFSGLRAAQEKVSQATEGLLSEDHSVASSAVCAHTSNLIVSVDHSRVSSCQNTLHLAEGRSCKILANLSISSDFDTFVVDIPEAEATSFAAEALQSGLARYVEPDYRYEAQLVPNDPLWLGQWGPQKTEADWAWNTTVGNSSLLVAVIDTGVDYNHPDLAANCVPLGYDWVNNDTDPIDDNGHGTHCAGIIAAVLNNHEGIAGIAQVKIMAEKGLDAEGSGYTSDLATAIVHATDQGAKIISMSWGGYGRSQTLHEAVHYAYSKGVLLMGAAGNDGITQELYPAAFDEVVAVAATDKDDSLAYFSNHGGWIELAAPGVNILSTISEVHASSLDYPYDSLSGTSMACPHAAGTAALVWSRYSNATNEWIRLLMQYAADDLGKAGFDAHFGYGRINARKAVDQQLPEHDLLVLGWQTPSYVEPGATVAINTTLFNFGKEEANVTIGLLVEGIIVDSALIGAIGHAASASVICRWTPTTERLYNVTTYIVPAVGEANTLNNAKSTDIMVSRKIIALLQNANPWGYSANQKALAPYGIACATFGSDSFGNVNLSKFLKVVIAADQDQEFYFALDAYRTWFDDFVRNGGTLEIHAADGGYNGGFAPGYLPGDLMWKRRPSDNVTIIDNAHPLVTEPYAITDQELDLWDLSAHGYFFGYPEGTDIVAIDQHYGRPVHITFRYGEGCIVASGITLEWGYRRRYSRILENTLLYTISDYPKLNHDVVVTDVTASPDSVYAGWIVNVTVTARNEGNATETFEVTAYYDNESLGTQTVFDLASGKEAVVTFTWNTNSLDERSAHTIWAEVSGILNEVNVDNNVLAGGVVKIRLMGDINDDDEVDISDVVLAAQAYASNPTDANWNPYADMAPKWQFIDIIDIVTLTFRYGES